MPLEPARYDAVTFDCYGTLIDWDTGVANALGPWVVRSGLQGTVAALIEGFARRQQERQRRRPIEPYTSLIANAFDEAARDLGGAPCERDRSAFGNSVGSWPAFPDTVDALRRLRACGLHLGVLSNVDRASFAATQERLGGLFDTVVTAEDVGAYKPDPRMFEALFEALGAKGVARDRVLHVAQSRFHDVAPGRALDLDVVWIDRRSGRPGRGVMIPSNAEPSHRFTSLEAFCDALLGSRPSSL